MKKLILAMVAVVSLTMISFIPGTLAADLDNGAKIFSANCASCHAGGRNVINSAKTLAKGDLEKYDMYSLDAIKYQVAKGKNAMPAFNSRLSEAEIENVAAYVLAQSEKGW